MWFYVSTNQSIVKKRTNTFDLNKITGGEWVRIDDYEGIKRIVTTGSQVYAEFDLESEIVYKTKKYPDGTPNQRNIGRFLSMSCIVIDIETKDVGGGLMKVQSSIEDIIGTELYRKFASFIYTSKSHRKGNNGDCIHWVIPLARGVDSYLLARRICQRMKKYLKSAGLVIDVCNAIQGFNATPITSKEDEDRFELILGPSKECLDVELWEHTHDLFKLPGVVEDPVEEETDEDSEYRISAKNLKLHNLLVEDWRANGMSSFCYQLMRRIANDIREIQTRTRSPKDTKHLLTFHQWQFIMGVFKSIFGANEGAMLTMLMSRGYVKNGVHDTTDTIWKSFIEVDVESNSHFYLTGLLRTYRKFMANNPWADISGKRVSKYARVAWMISNWLKANGHDLLTKEELVNEFGDQRYFCSDSPKTRSFRSVDSVVKTKAIREKASDLREIPLTFVSSGSVVEFRKIYQPTTYSELAEEIVDRVEDELSKYDIIPKAEVNRIIKEIRSEYIPDEKAKNYEQLQFKSIFAGLECIEEVVHGRSRSVVCKIAKKAA